MRLAGKVAIVTGAGRGIGRATAVRFAQEGAAVAVLDREGSWAEEVAGVVAADGGRAIAVGADVVDRGQVDGAVERVVDELGPIDVLVNNAGIVSDARLVNMEPEQFDAVLDTNLRGVFNCTQAVVGGMLERRRGVILSASSVVGVYGNYGQTNYVASKAGVIGMTRVWARELGPRGIRVNAVAPGFIDTAMTQAVPKRLLDRVVEHVPMRRLGDPLEVANAYLWLASDEASYVNGQVLGVDGGLVV